MGHFSKRALALGTAAILATSMAPAVAAVPRGEGKSILKLAGEYNGWGRSHRYRHRDRVDGGDILAGIAVLAGIAIIADAASKDKRRERVPESYPVDDGPYDGEQPYDDRNDGNERPYESGGVGSNDVGSAVETCSAAAEREAGGDARVGEIRSVTRDGEGWRVEGDLDGGDAQGFVCGTTGGQIDSIEIDGDRSL